MSVSSSLSLVRGDSRLGPKELSLSALAKVNLTLEVPGRLPSGLHAITSILCPLSLEDRIFLRVEEEGGVRFSCVVSDTLRRRSQSDGEGGDSAVGELSGPKNLAFRAAQSFLQAAGLEQSIGLDIRLEKNVPFEAGLGGGSSDAAAVLRGLSVLFPEHLSVDQVYALGRDLGSDVPALIEPGLKLIGGSGEQVLPLSPGSSSAFAALDKCKVLVLKPPKGISTAAAYAALRRPLLCDAPCRTSRAEFLMRALGVGSDAPVKGQHHRRNELTLFGQEGISGGPVSTAKLESIFSAFHNDFEEIAFVQAPELRQGRDLLLGVGAKRVLLAGSGSALVGFCPTVERSSGNGSLAGAVSILREQAPQGWFIAVAELRPLI